MSAADLLAFLAGSAGPLVLAVAWLLVETMRLRRSVERTRDELLDLARRVRRIEDPNEQLAGLRAFLARSNRRGRQVQAALAGWEELGIGVGVDPAAADPLGDDPLLEEFRALEREVLRRDCPHPRHARRQKIGSRRPVCVQCGAEVGP